MQVVYATQEPPERFDRSVFLVGPTPRSKEVPSWRPEMLEALRKAGYDGVVFIPEDKNGKWSHSYVDQVEWEYQCLNMSDVILAWVPRDVETMPAFTTNVEFGMWLTSGKLVYGHPENAEKVRYLDHWYQVETTQEPLGSLEEMAQAAVEKTRRGALRIGGERDVPLFVWNTPSFQSWLLTHRAVQNQIDGAKLLWNFRVGPQKSFLFCYTLWVKMWIEAEGRHKENEFVFTRPDISCVVAYHKGAGGVVRVVLIREFRSPARTVDGFIHELPGGSTVKPGVEPAVLASQELQEETGLRIRPERFREVGTRQIAGTLSTHMASVFAVELTSAEVARVSADVTAGEVFGEEKDTERTYLELRSVDTILRHSQDDMDWSMVGMLLTALQGE